ncbi:MAG: hypothetical protein M1838_001749 [Thelocarpon superellum]|nr:MAG: hypothetical protein M1838_001749 [Thelocarpon superellum]
MTKSEVRIDEDQWQLTVGIEIHAQLHTERKLFSDAATSVNDEPNTHVSVFDAALPGTQPNFRSEVLLPAVRAALALNCKVQHISRFDRKHYFYHDQPAGYQITQYYHPLALDGHVDLFGHDGIAPEDGEAVRIGIKQIQLEQDTAKTLVQSPSTHLIDLNRVSSPLIEIITLPQMHHPNTAAACVRKLQTILRSVGACVVGMELGGLRADVNVSVRRRNASQGQADGHHYHGIAGLGQRTEIKNLSSFKAVEGAIRAERDRQIRVLESGGSVVGETRGWELGGSETTLLRSKEGEVDYRYMPDPDLGPIVVSPQVIEQLRGGLPMLPDQLLGSLTSLRSYGLTVKDAKTLMALDDGARVDYYCDVVQRVHAALPPAAETDADASLLGKMVGNWVLHELGGLLANADTPWDQSPVPASRLADILGLLATKQITAKYLLSTAFGGDSRIIAHIVADEHLLLRPMSEAEYDALARRVMHAQGKTVEQIREKGQVGKINFLLGQMMRQGEEGRVEARKAETVLRRLLQP